jgi:hypothetical protein
MPLQKLQFRPGVNREGTTLANEGGWFDGDKIRFRSGFPEKLGGWQAISPITFIGVCRSLWNWVTLKAYNLLGVGTEAKFYIENGGAYYDITPIRLSTSGTASFTATTGSAVITVTDPNFGGITGDYVTFSGAVSLGGAITDTVLNQQYQITYVNTNTYTFIATATATSSDTGHGGSSVVASYQLSNGTSTGASQTGWGAGYWGGFVTNTAVNSLNGNITNAATTITVISTSGFPAGSVGSPGLLQIDNELITYTGTTGTTFTGCVRGASGTVAAAHSSGALVEDASTFHGWGQSASASANTTLRLWSQANFGQDLLFNPRGGGIYHWTPGSSALPTFNIRGNLVGSFTGIANTTNTSTTLTVTFANAGTIQLGMFVSGTGIPVGTYIAAFISGTGGAGTYTLSAAATASNTGITVTGTSDVPSIVNSIMVSDSTRIVIAFGCNDLLTSATPTALDPMLVRWSATEDYTNWTPSSTNQAGGYRLSHGSVIVGAKQTRQEIIIFTDAAVYSMQYLGPPYIWGFTLLADNISIMSQNAMTTANGVTYWMGRDKFYVYSGRVETLPCALRSYVFDDINQTQTGQIFCGTNEGFSEIWWFYCSANSNQIDKYVIFNYLDRVWYYGTMARSAWNDSPLRDFPQAATYTNQIANHEDGNDDNLGLSPLPINAFVQSSDFDIGDGHNYGFVWQIIPDITFDGSTTPSPDYPRVNFTVRPRRNPGSGYGTADTPLISSTQSYAGQSTYNVQQFTEVVNARLRGRQMAFKVSSDTLGTQWQLGTPRLNVRPDGRK